MLKLFGQPAAYVHGNLFFGVYGNRIFVRLPESEGEALIASDGAVHHEPLRARPLPGFVSLSTLSLTNRKRGVEIVRKALEYTANLPVSSPEVRPRESDRLWWSSGGGIRGPDE